MLVNHERNKTKHISFYINSYFQLILIIHISYICAFSYSRIFVTLKWIFSKHWYLQKYSWIEWQKSIAQHKLPSTSWCSAFPLQPSHCKQASFCGLGWRFQTFELLFIGAELLFYEAQQVWQVLWRKCVCYVSFFQACLKRHWPWFQ